MSRADIAKILDAAILWAFCPTAGGYRGGPAIEDTCEALGDAVRNYLGVDIDTPPDEWWSVEEMRAAIAEGVVGREQNYDEVICPNCVHQFPAIPVNVQKELSDLRARVAEQAHQITVLRSRVAEQEAYAQSIDAWCRRGEVMVEREGNSIMFRLGELWAERPWKKP